MNTKEFKIIKNTKAPVTYSYLCESFKKIGIEEGDVVLVHSSLSSLGWVCGREIAVIEALLTSVGEMGTVVMPAHTGDNTEPKYWINPPVPKDWLEVIRENMPPFDILKSPTRGMGKIAECFRTFPNTERSYHPQVSFCANGKDAKDIVKLHSLTPQFGPQTPLGALYRLNAKILLIGVGYMNCTALHLGEMLSGTPKKELSGSAVLENGVRKWIEIEDYAWDSDDFEDLGNDFEENGGQVTFLQIGNALCRLIDMKSLVDFSINWFKEHRKG